MSMSQFIKVVSYWLHIWLVCNQVALTQNPGGPDDKYVHIQDIISKSQDIWLFVHLIWRWAQSINQQVGDVVHCLPASPVPLRPYLH